MIRSALFLALLLGQTIAAQNIVRENVYDGELAPTRSAPTFDNGRLIIFERGTRISIRPPLGAPPITLSVQTPGSAVSMLDGAVDTDGVIAASILGYGVTGLAIFQPDGRQERFIETTPYMPTAIRFGPDHTIWTLGETVPQTKPQPDYAILRNFSRDGRLSGAYLPRAMFKEEASLAPFNSSLGLLHVAGGRVGMMLDFSDRAAKVQWLETDLSGKLAGRWDMPHGYLVKGIAAFATVYASRNPGSPIMAFHRATQEWKPVSIAAEGRLIGVDGESLVFIAPGGLARWVSLPK